MRHGAWGGGIPHLPGGWGPPPPCKQASLHESIGL